MKDNQKIIACVLIFFFVGLWLGIRLTSFFIIRSNNEISLLHHSIEFGNASMNLLLHDQLINGEIDQVKEALLDNYQKTKKKANALNLDALANENWPFTVDAWFIEDLKNSINYLNDPYPCKNKLTSSSTFGSSCNG